MSVSAPTKFVTNPATGVRMISPEYKEWMKRQDGTSATSDVETLAVVSNLNEILSLGSGTQQSSSLATSIEKMHSDPRFAAQVGIPSPSILEQLGTVFAKWETPVGLLSKLLMLTEFDKIEIWVDSSGSIRKSTSAELGLFNKTGEPISRWEETKLRIFEMMEILVFLPFPPVEIRFLTDPKVVKINYSLKDPNEPPAAFFQRVKAIIEDEMNFRPTGQTPALKCLTESFQNQQKIANDKKWIRYFFTDGRPDGDDRAIRSIAELISNRFNPADNPITFLSVTDTPSDTAWCSEVEGSAPYCAEVSNHVIEIRQIRAAQGSAFPITKGFCIIAALIGALCPNDIDLLDEGIPLPKAVLDGDIQGYVCSEEEYEYYFKCFTMAQVTAASATLRNDPQNKRALLQRFFTEKWKAHYHEFKTKA